MKKPEEIFELLKKELPDCVIDLNSELPVESIINVHPLSINIVSKYLRDTEGLEFDSLMVLSGVDDANDEKKKEEDGTQSIISGTLSVYYHLYSTYVKHKITLRVSTNKDKPDVESVESIWKCADWHEREAYDMIGIKFLNHPDLRRILMPYDWEDGHPLRKDYKNPEFYQGMKVPY